ncbi:MAG TPA: serine/threonine-protein kinase [Gemmatimonadaceae bacterium]|nr:serine/threonine-protein kinase [Gemmatimonadaceae bacterium]
MPDLLQDRVVAAIGDLYDLQGELGRGGSAVVYRAIDVRLRRPVAIKVLPPDFAFRGDVRSRFLREAETAARLSHPNIVPIFAVDERDGLVYFVMALVDGESLASRLARDRRPPLGVVRRVLREVADALAYAHGKGVVHRDVKPDNVLIDRESGRAMVTDFGIARAAEGDGRLTVTGVAVGTPAYMSPEQALGERDVDGRSDVYSLGIVGYEMLAGAPPFAATSAPAMLMKQLSEAPRPLAERRPDVPPALAAAISRALAKSPSDRWPDAAAFRDAVDADAAAAGGIRTTPTDADDDGAWDRSGRFGWHPVDRDLRDRARERLSGERERPPAAQRLARPRVTPAAPLPALPPREPERWGAPASREAGARRLSHGGAPGASERAGERATRHEARHDAREARREARPHEGADHRERDLRRYETRPLEERVAIFRRKTLWAAGTLTFLGVINLATTGVPWVIFPAIGFVSDLLARWRSIHRDGVGFWEAMLGEGPRRDGAASAAAARAARPGAEPLVERTRRFRAHAAVAAGLGALTVGAAGLGVATHGANEVIMLASLSGVGTTIAALDAAARGWSLRAAGLRLRDALGQRWRQAAALADPRPAAVKLADAASALVPQAVLDGPHGATVRRAVEDQTAVREIVHRLSPADRALLPDVEPTVTSLVGRVASLASALHRLDADVLPADRTALDARIAAAEAEPEGTPDRERRVQLLLRQRASLDDLAARRGTLAGQLESAALVLQNIRLDLLKVRSAGVGSTVDELTSATQEARALSRDIGHVLAAAKEVRDLQR